MNLLINNKNTGEIIHSLDVGNFDLEPFTDNRYCYNDKGYKILSMPQLYARVRSGNIDCNFVVKEVIKEEDNVTVIGEKENKKYKLSFKMKEYNCSITISPAEYKEILDRLYYLRRILLKLSDDSPEINSMRKTVEEIGRILTYNNSEEKFKNEYKEKE